MGLDRYWYSTHAYQGAEGVSKILIWAINYVATRGLKPNLVLHYDLLPEKAIGRRRGKYQSDIDRYDAREIEFHKIVRGNYLQLKLLYPGIWETIDASKSTEEVKEESLRLLRKHGVIK